MRIFDIMKDFFRSNIRVIVTLMFLFFAFIDTFFAELTWVTLVLLLVSLLPWALPYFSSITLPGGGTFNVQEFHNAIRRFETGARDGADGEEVSKYLQESTGTLDVALMRARRDIEVELKRLAEAHGAKEYRFSMRRSVDFLRKNEVISHNSAALVYDVMPALNGAVHGEPISEEVAKNILSYCVELISELRKTP